MLISQDVALVSSPVFWFVLAFIPCVALIFDVAAKTVHNTFYPALTTAVRAMEIAGAEDIGAFLRHQKQDFAQHDEEMANQINTEQAVLIDRFEARPIAAKNKNPSPNSRHYKHGYAFSQDENGALGQSDYVSAYRPRGYGSMDSLHHTLSDVPDSEWFSHQRHKSLDAGNLAERRRPKTG